MEETPVLRYKLYGHDDLSNPQARSFVESFATFEEALRAGKKLLGHSVTITDKEKTPGTFYWAPTAIFVAHKRAVIDAAKTLAPDQAGATTLLLRRLEALEGWKVATDLDTPENVVSPI